MKRRLFIGIPVPEDVGKRFDQKLAPIAQLPVIWTPKKNRHITVFFLGWIDDEKLPKIVSDITEACADIPAFDVAIDCIIVTPEENPDRIEATGEGNEDLKNLSNAITNVLDEFSIDRLSFHPHITLGRVRRSQWKTLPEKPVIDIPVRFSIPAAEVCIFESVAIEGKREYVAVETILLV